MKVRYRDRLKAHPGKELATIMTIFGGLAGMANDSFSLGGGFIFGLLAMGIPLWSIVLWTARTQPVD